MKINSKLISKKNVTILFTLVIAFLVGMIPLIIMASMGYLKFKYIVAVACIIFLIETKRYKN